MLLSCPAHVLFGSDQSPLRWLQLFPDDVAGGPAVGGAVVVAADVQLAVVVVDGRPAVAVVADVLVLALLPIVEHATVVAAVGLDDVPLQLLAVVAAVAGPAVWHR